MKRILVPLDGSRLSESVLPLAEALARAWGAEVFLLQALRGHDSGSLIRHLVRLGLIAAESSGHYGTTPRFLELFGLQSLDDLPRTTDLQKI